VTGPNQSTDVLIVGGGPAGLAAAIAISNKGFRVTVVDGHAPPIDKPCGEGMMPETLAALLHLGVSFVPPEGFPFRGITLAQDGARISADFPRGRALGLRRPILHERLAARAEECGVRLLWRTVVTGIAGDSVLLSQGTMRAEWIVGADGHGSRVRRWIGLDSATHDRPRYANRRHYRMRPWSQTMEIHWAGRSQAYVTPIADDEVCVVMMAETAEEAAFERAILEMPELREKLADAQLSSR
jgi:2-polyprenyl-6-methoxyphenol hydroxylase-like FAD-dependent oxidoreductase